MMIFRAASWQVPFLTLTVGDVDPKDANIRSVFLSAINSIANRYAADSQRNQTVANSYTSGALTLSTLGVPFFPDLSIAKVKASNSFTVPFSVRTNNSTRTFNAPACNQGTALRTNLCQYLVSKIQIAHIKARASAEGVGLTTKERYQISRAEQESERLGNTAMSFFDACDSPIALTAQGLFIKAGLTYSPFSSVAHVLQGSSSPLAPLITQHKSSLISFYKRLFPVAPIESIIKAMNDAGIDDYYATEFKCYYIPSSVSTMVQKSPLTRQMESYPIAEAMSLVSFYLATVIRKKVDSEEITPLVTEYITALKRRGFKTSKSNLIEGRLMLASALEDLSGFTTDIDLASVIAAHYNWANFSNKSTDKGSQYHPMLWDSFALDGVTLSGIAPNKESSSVDLDESVLPLVRLMVENRSMVHTLLSGWEDHIAATMAASYSDFVQTATAFRIKSFGPILRSVGVTAGMMPDDVVGVIYV